MIDNCLLERQRGEEGWAEAEERKERVEERRGGIREGGIEGRGG